MNEEERYVPMRARYDGRCANEECTVSIVARDVIVWDTFEHKAYCKECGEELRREEEA